MVLGSIICLSLVWILLVIPLVCAQVVHSKVDVLVATRALCSHGLAPGALWCNEAAQAAAGILIFDGRTVRARCSRACLPHFA